MIATTNLTQNLDPAFEHRFLYKICFEKPDVEVRKKIWETMIPSLSDQEYSLLAAAYEFSGGQMENIARKYAIGTILNGEPEDRLSVLYSYCNAEKLDNTVRRRIGF
jgi:AAA+ superfamily predicted ATPase